MKEPMSTDTIHDLLQDISMWFFDHEVATEDISNFLQSKGYDEETIKSFLEGDF